MDLQVKLPPRRPDWRLRLVEFVAGVSRVEFKPGSHDCALFAAGGVEAITGVDLASDWRATYRTLSAGRRALLAAGFSDHVEFVARLLPEIASSMAQVGDVAVVPGEDGEFALGIVQGEGVYCLRPDGLAVVSRLQMVRAFRV